MNRTTPLDTWIRERAGIGTDPGGRAYRDALKAYQLRRLNWTLRHARSNTSFYRRHLASLPDRSLSTLFEITKIPFTTPSDIAKDPFTFLAVPQGDVARIVTLRTSGSTGRPKRIFFTRGDLEMTVDFFHHGMSTLVGPGQRVAILLPGETPDSVGDLLARGLERMGVRTLIYGPVTDPMDAAEAISSFNARCLVGIPTQVLSVACSKEGRDIPEGAIESVLLSTDYVPRAIVKTLGKIWGCRVFNHYGMTETGLGGGVECSALSGYHLREADLYFEVVDHETGAPCPDGVTGEVVFTTLTRQAMPLIRYRTGDIARIMPGHCTCGSALRRMECVRGRWDGVVSLGQGYILALPDMDEALFMLPGLLDYRASVTRVGDGRALLSVEVHRQEGDDPGLREVLGALHGIDAISGAVAEGVLGAPVIRFTTEGCLRTNGTTKRRIITGEDPVE